MILSKIISYKETTPSNWDLLEFDLENINLIVGLNASGKSRILSVIRGLAQIVYTSQQIPFSDVYYKVEFISENQSIYSYEIEFLNGIVRKEILLIDNYKRIDRNEHGDVSIYSEVLKSVIDLKIPENQLMTTRRDAYNFPYLEELYKWAVSIRYFRFTQQNSKYNYEFVEANRTIRNDFDLKVTDQTIRAFQSGVDLYRNKFTDSVIADFNEIGYEISEIRIDQLNSVKSENNQKNSYFGIHVRERDLDFSVDQAQMSDGMFRALSIIIHINLYEFQGLPYCILVDDIGEGLDFQRATKLIQLLIRKSPTNAQLIMTSNDKFIMNNVDLDYWNVIIRKGFSVKLINKRNSPKVFKEFEFTGLNNFDFLSTGFYAEDSITN